MNEAASAQALEFLFVVLAAKQGTCEEFHGSAGADIEFRITVVRWPNKWYEERLAVSVLHAFTDDTDVLVEYYTVITVKGYVYY